MTEIGLNRQRGQHGARVDGSARVTSDGGVERRTRTTAIRILIVDQHDLHREGLARLLAAGEGLRVVGGASGGNMAVRLAAELRPHVVLMDPRLSDLDGAAAAQAILRQDNSVRLIAFSVLAADSDVKRALGAGFCGYLPKESPIDDVVAAVQAAAHGTAWLAPHAAQAVLNRVSHGHDDGDQAPDGLNGLSGYELEVLRVLARGGNSNDIAAGLSISPRTAESHVSSILSKLGLNDRVQAG